MHIWRMSAAGLATALTAVLVNGAPASAGAVTKSISFDESTAPSTFAETNPLRNEYAGKGIHFTGPGPLDGGAILDDSTWGITARSGHQFLAFNSGAGPMINGGSPVGPETITFDRLQRVVKIYVSQTYSTGTATFKMVAKRAGVRVDRSTASTTTGDWLLLRVSAPRGIRKVVLSANDPDGAWAADDLTIRRG